MLVGQPATFTATVGALGLEGTVDFSGNFTDLCPGTGLKQVTLPSTSTNDGGIQIITVGATVDQATCTTTFTKPGTEYLFATFSGDAAGDEPSQGELTVNVLSNPVDTTTSLAPSTTTPAAGQPVTYTATVSDTAGITPAGSVTFTNGNTTLCSAVSLSTSAPFTATCSTTYQTPFSAQTVSANYSGDTTSASSKAQVTVNVKDGTTTSLSSSPSAPASGQPLSLTVGQSLSLAAKVDGTTSLINAPVPTGTLTFSIDGQQVGDPVAVTRPSLTGTPGVTSAPLTEALATSAPITNLAPGVHQVVATYEGDGNYAGSVSSTLTVNVVIAVPNPTFTLVSPPDAPTGLSSTPGNSQVVLNWTTPANNGGDPVTGYSIYQGTSSGSETLLQSTGTTATTFTSTGLTNGTTYYFKVTAVTLAGEGSGSNEVSATPATAAGAPTTLAATASDTEVDLNWTSPANNGGDPVTGYNIYQGTSSGAETILTSTSTTATTFTSTGLTNGTTYYFKVTAVSLAGEGPFSNEVSATPATAAGAPTTLAATASGSEVDLWWTSPANNGGDPVTGYNIYQGTSSGAETILTSTSTTATTFRSTGLTNGTTYYFKVTAVTLAGEGPFSNEVSATPATLPAATSGLSATAGNGRAVLDWTAPANNGGSAITSYNVYEGTSPGGETLLQSTASSAPTFTVTGLTNGTTYYFKVTAVNGVGEGPVSDEASATPATLPGASSGLRATAGNAEAVLNWTAPANNGGSAITSYNVYEGASPGGETLQQSTGSSASTFTVTGLTNGTTYYFKVTAVNGVGEGLFPMRPRPRRLRCLTPRGGSAPAPATRTFSSAGRSPQ